MTTRRVAVIVPCRNEAPTIAAVVTSLREVLPESVVYVADNGSVDGTAALAEVAGATVVHVGRRGKGLAVRRLFADVEADCYVMVDGDATYDATTATELVRQVLENGVDMAVGVRETTGTQSDAYRSGHKRGNSALSWIFRRLFALPLADTLSGYRAFSRRFVKTFADTSAGFELETDLNAHAAALQVEVAEVSTSYVSRPEGSSSKLNTYQDGWRILRRNLRLFRDARPLLSFVILAAPWALAAVGLVGSAVLEYLSTGLVLRFPSLIAGVGAFLVALNLWAAGLVIDRVSRVRTEALRLRYLALAGPLHS